MLKELVQYTDYNDTEQTETVYFNLTRTEMMDLLDLQPRLEAWANKTTNEDRELNVDEIKELLSIIKLLIEKSYGVRSDDGKHFRKSENLFEEFKQSAVYDSFVFGLFEDPEKAVSFMTGIIPKQFMEEATTTPTSTLIKDVPLPEEATEISAVDTEVPAYIREDRDPTPAELRTMSPDELQAAFKRRLSN